MTETVPSRVLLLLPDEDADTVSPAVALRLASLYFRFREAKVEMVFASVSGGFSAIVGELRRLVDDPNVARIMADPLARDELSETVALVRVYVEDFDALVSFVEGDEFNSPAFGRVKSGFLDAGKYVAAAEALDQVEAQFHAHWRP